MSDIRNASADAWGGYIEQYVNAGWKPYFLTCMFEPLAGNQAAKMAQMARYLEVAYAIFVTRVVRKPRIAAVRGVAPVWLCVPDLPVYKRTKKQSIHDLTLNDGLHYHVTLLLRRSHASKTSRCTSRICGRYTGSALCSIVSMSSRSSIAIGMCRDTATNRSSAGGLMSEIILCCRER